VITYFWPHAVGMMATTFLIRVLQNIDFVGWVIIAVKICHDTTSISRYLIRYDTIYRAITRAGAI